MRRIVCPLIIVLALVFAACDTDPASNVTESAATLNGSVNCTYGFGPGTVRFQYQRIDPGGSYPWVNVNGFDSYNNGGPWDGRFGKCGATTGEQPVRKRVSGLPGQNYQYRLVTTPDGGGSLCTDSRGDTQPCADARGQVYDTFSLVQAPPPPADNQPVANFTISPNPAVRGEETTFTSTGTCGDGPCSYAWLFEDGEQFDSGNPGQFTYVGSGSSRTVTLRVTDADGDVDTETKTFGLVDGDDPDPPPPPPPVDTDGDGVPDSEDNCPNEDGPASNDGCPEPPPPPPPTGDGLIPSNAVLVRQDQHNGSGSRSSSQCPSGGSITEQNGYVRLYRPAGGGQAAGGYRCEFQWGANMGPGEEHWMTYRARYPTGFQGGCGAWCTGFQIHEVVQPGTGPVDAAMFYGNGFQWWGDFIGRTDSSSSVDVRDWHVYTVKAEMETTDNRDPDEGPVGRITFWIDGVPYGSTEGRNMTPGGDSYIKYGHYGGNDATREAHFDYVEHYEVP
jgi:hypothetical protein